MDDLNRASPTAIGSLFEKYTAQIVEDRRKIDYEFELLCLENQDFFGHMVWTLPYKPQITDSVLREAFKVARDGIERKRGTSKVDPFPKVQDRFRYLYGCIKRLIAPHK